MKNECKPEARILGTQDVKCENMQDSAIQLSIHYCIQSLSEETCIQYEECRDKLIEPGDFYMPLKPLTKTNDQNSKDSHLKEYFPKSNYHFSQYFKHDPHQNILENKWY